MNDAEPANDSASQLSVVVSAIPILALMGLMLLNVKLDDDYVPTEIVIVVCAVLAGAIAYFYVGTPYKVIETGNAAVDRLLNRGGMASMFSVNFVAIIAMVLGGILEVNGMLRTLTHSLISRVRGIGSLVVSTLGTCMFVNCAAAKPANIVLANCVFFYLITRLLICFNRQSGSPVSFLFAQGNLNRSRTETAASEGRPVTKLAALVLSVGSQSVTKGSFGANCSKQLALP